MTTVKTSQIQNQLSKGYTTDDLLDQRQEKIQIQDNQVLNTVDTTYPSLHLENEKQIKIKGRNNLIGRTNLTVSSLQDYKQIINNNPQVRQPLNKILGGVQYQSQSVLTNKPISIEYQTEINFDKQFKISGTYNAVGDSAISKFMVSKQDMQNLKRNQSLSKEFLIKNKKELEEFIKSQKRTGFNNNNNNNNISIEKSSNQSKQVFTQRNGIQYTQSQRFDGSHLKGSKQVLEDDPDLYFSKQEDEILNENNIKTEKKLKTIQQSISSKVVENWINQTLTDSENLDIPSVILHPKSKIPINRYGIDRLSLTSAGISNETCNRIYRSLFVYSVGFFESLKKQVTSNCNPDKQITILIALWKTFCVLLEFSCKTEYQLMISQITIQHEAEKDQIYAHQKTIVEKEVEEKRQLKQNMFVMQAQMENLEKLMNNEQSLRLKLEEEYRVVQRNHEEEVELRLQFESRLNALNTEFRELDIKFKRNLIQLELSNNNINRLELQCKEQIEQLVKLRSDETDHISRIAVLSDFQSSAIKEINKKNSLIKEAEDQKKQAIDRADEIKFQQQDQDNLTKRLQMRVQDLTAIKIALENQIIALETQVEEFKDLDQVKKQQIQNQINQYEELAAKFSKQNEVFQVMQITSSDRKRLIEQLQRQLETKLLSNEDFEMQALIYKTQRDELDRQLKQSKSELETCSQHLQLMNKERHEYQDKYKEALSQIQLLNDEIIDIKWQIDSQSFVISNHVKTIQEQQLTIQDLQKEVDKVNLAFEIKVKDLRENITQLQQQIAHLGEDNLILKDQNIKYLDQNFVNLQIVQQKDAEIEKLTQQFQNTQEMLQRQVAQSFRDLERTMAAQKQANEAIKRQHQLEETLRYMKQNQDAKDSFHRNRIMTTEQKSLHEQDQCQMIVEDTEGKMLQLMSKIFELEQLKKELEELQLTMVGLSEVQSQNEVLKQKLGQKQEDVEIMIQVLKEQEDQFELIFESVMKQEENRYQLKISEIEEQLQNSQQQVVTLKEQSSEFKMRVVKLQLELKDSAQLIEKYKLNEKMSQKLPQQKSSVFDQVAQEAKNLKQKREKIGNQIMGKQNQRNQVKDSGSSSLSNSLSRERLSIEKKSSNQTISPLNITLNHIHSIEEKSADIEQTGRNDPIYNNEQTPVQKANIHIEQTSEQEEQSLEVKVNLDSLPPEQEVIVEIEPTPVQQVTKIDYQELKFIEYQDYMDLQQQHLLEQVKQRLHKRGKSLPSILKELFAEEKQKVLPEQFRNLKLNQKQKEILDQNFNEALMKFEIENENLIPNELLRDEGNSNGQTSQKHKKTRSNRFQSMFMDFAKNNSKMLEKLVKENEERIAKLAIERRKVALVVEEPKDRIVGQKQYHFLLKMSKDPDYYEVHRNLYFDALSKAKQEKDERIKSREREEAEQQKKADELAQALLEHYKAKAAKIIVERPYLQVSQNVQTQNKELQQKNEIDRPVNDLASKQYQMTTPNFSNMNKQISIMKSQQEQEEVNIIGDHNSQSVNELIQKVRMLRQLDQKIPQNYVEGGVARVHNESRSKLAQQSDQNQQSIKTKSSNNHSFRNMLRAANSRHRV